MAKKEEKYLYRKPRSGKSQDPLLNCDEELDELAKFETSDQAPVQASETFKKSLREKLWNLLKDKYYIFFALAAFLFS